MQFTARHWDIAVSSMPTRAPVQALSAIVKAFAEAALRGDAIWRRGVNVFEIKRVRFNSAGTRAILLARFANAGAPEMASAHVVIDLTVTDGGYRAIVQENGLTKAALEQGMQELTRRLMPFYFPDTGKKFKQAHARLSFTASDEVQFALEQGAARCDADIRADISVQLDTLLRRRAVKRAA